MDFLYYHNLSPFLWHATLASHSMGIRWYGVAYLLGLCSAFAAFRIANQRGVLRGFDDEAQMQFMIATALGVIGGGRLGFVVQHPQRLLTDPKFVFQVWEGGMAFFGGLVGVILAMLWTARRYQISFWSMADVATFPAAFGLGVGRVANFINGELWGKPTGAHWGVVFPHADSLPRYPSQLYEAASHFLLLGILLWLARRHPNCLREKSGMLAAWFLIIYGISRLATDFYRADDTYFGPLSSGQWASLIVALAGCVLLRVRNQRALQVLAAQL